MTFTSCFAAWRMWELCLQGLAYITRLGATFRLSILSISACCCDEMNNVESMEWDSLCWRSQNLFQVEPGEKVLEHLRCIWRLEMNVMLNLFEDKEVTRRKRVPREAALVSTWCTCAQRRSDQLWKRLRRSKSRISRFVRINFYVAMQTFRLSDFIFSSMKSSLTFPFVWICRFAIM